MRGWVVLTAVLPVVIGCQTHVYLRDSTLRTASTLTDLNYQQMLNNVARFTACPSTLPSLAVVSTGTVTVSDQRSFNGNATYSPTLTFAQQGGGALPILSLLFNPSLARNLTENWSMSSITDMDSLQRIRCAFQLLVCGSETSNCDKCYQKVEDFFLADAERMKCLVPRGWYCIGCEKDVPDSACYVGHYGDVYAWVMPEGMDGLAHFTMTVMELATSKPTTPTQTVVKKYKADGVLEATEVTTTELDEKALARMKKDPRWPDSRRAIQGPTANPGLFFVPH